MQTITTQLADTLRAITAATGGNPPEWLTAELLAADRVLAAYDAQTKAQAPVTNAHGVHGIHCLQRDDEAGRFANDEAARTYVADSIERIADDLSSWLRQPFVSLTAMRVMDVQEFITRLRALSPAGGDLHHAVWSMVRPYIQPAAREKVNAALKETLAASPQQEQGAMTAESLAATWRARADDLADEMIPGTSNKEITLLRDLADELEAELVPTPADESYASGQTLAGAGGEWAEKARQMIVELRDYVVNERDAQVLPRKRAGYQRELDEIDALLAASPQQEPGAVREMSQADCPHKGAYSYRDGWATGWNDCRAALLQQLAENEARIEAYARNEEAKAIDLRECEHVRGQLRKRAEAAESKLAEQAAEIERLGECLRVFICDCQQWSYDSLDTEGGKRIALEWMTRYNGNKRRAEAASPQQEPGAVAPRPQDAATPTSGEMVDPTPPCIAMVEGNAWYDHFARPIAELTGCLPSVFPDGNGHIIRAVAALTATSAGTTGDDSEDAAALLGARP